MIRWLELQSPKYPCMRCGPIGVDFTISLTYQSELERRTEVQIVFSFKIHRTLDIYYKPIAVILMRNVKNI